MAVNVWLSSSWLQDIAKQDGRYEFFSRTAINGGYTYGFGRLKVHLKRGPWSFRYQGDDNRWSKESAR